MQVLSEFTNVTTKLVHALGRSGDVWGLSGSAVRPLTLPCMTRHWHDCPRYGLGWYDALIVAAALDGGGLLYSEDMHDGLE